MSKALPLVEPLAYYLLSVQMNSDGGDKLKSVFLVDFENEEI